MDNLQKIRKSKGLTQAEVAEALGVTQGAVSGWESGRWNPSLDNLMALREVLDEPVEELAKKEVTDDRA